MKKWISKRSLVKDLQIFPIASHNAHPNNPSPIASDRGVGSD